MPRPRNEQCPERGPGLTHTVDGGILCVHCGAVTALTLGDMIRAMLQPPVATEAPQEEPQEGPEPLPEADPPEVGWCQWQKGHWSTAIWYTANDGRWYCLGHLRRIVEIALWRG